MKFKHLYYFLAVCLSACGDKSPEKTPEPVKEPVDQASETPSTKTKVSENPYTDLRKGALGVHPEDLNLKLPDDRQVVYGMVMDWEMEGNIATLVAFQTGDASLYMSSGGAVIGGGQHQEVRDAVEQYITMSNRYLSKATSTDQTPLPQNKDEVIFYFLTNKGIYKAVDNLKYIEDRSSVLLPLFDGANEVMTMLREKTGMTVE